MDRTMKVFLACALGAFVGALVALEVNSYFWWLGMLAGGLVGYFSYEFKAVVVAIPRAWRAATSWRPDAERWRTFSKSWVYGALATTAFSIPWGLLVFLMSLTYTEVTDKTDKMEWFIGNMVIYGLGFPLLFGAVMGWLAHSEAKQYAKLRLFGTKCNIVSILFWQLPRGLWWLIRCTPNAIQAIEEGTRVAATAVRRFSWVLFKLIHSDERLLCGVDAAVGAGIGYWAGNATIGALAGGLFGVINYELISKRWLKLVPAKNY